MSDIDDEKYLRFQDRSTCVEMREALSYKGKLTPEHLLCKQLLEDAIESLSFTDEGGLRAHEVRRDAINWLKGKTPARVTFVMVCDLLSTTGTLFDADLIREKLLKHAAAVKSKGSLCLHLKESLLPEQTTPSSQAS